MIDEICSVSIVEDDAEIREMLAMIIDHTPGFICKHTYSDIASAEKGLPEYTPDVVLQDINLPDGSGIELVLKLKGKLPHTDFVMLTIREDDGAVFDSICAGATGYLKKETPPAELLQAIRDVRRGGAPMSPSIARKVVASFKVKQEHSLTAREVEILKLLCNGQNYRQVAEALYVSPNTISTHIKNIYSKLQVNTRAEMVKKAMQEKLV